jgi:hypothetical protein
METKKNDDGTFTVVLGNPRARTKNALVFPTETLEKAVFDLNVRAKRGTALAELEYPRKQPGEDTVSYVGRLSTINMDRVCARFTDFTIEQGDTHNPRITARLVPTGPFGQVARDLLNVAAPGVYFGMRAFTDDHATDDGIVRHVRSIVTYDLVSESADLSGQRMPNHVDPASLEGPEVSG